MAEFVAHEVEVAAARCEERHQPYHFVQCHAAVHGHAVAAGLHRVVHGGVHQSEDDGLVAHQRLVVAFGVVDGLFFGAVLGQFVVDFANGPFFVGLFLYQFYPVVGHAHRQPVVESDAAGVDAACYAGVSAHLFGNGDGPRVDQMGHAVGHGQICQCVFVFVAVEIVGIRREVLAQSVVEVEHAGDAVEAEAVDVIFFHPVADVGEQEALHLR